MFVRFILFRSIYGMLLPLMMSLLFTSPVVLGQVIAPPPAAKQDLAEQEPGDSVPAPVDRIGVRGSFSMGNGKQHMSFTWLNPGLGRGFQAQVTTNALDSFFKVGTGANDWVMAMAAQRDGKIFIGGYFTTINGVRRHRIARLHADGTLDTTFDPGLGPNDGVLALAVQPDGKLIVGGYFTAINGARRNYLARLNSDGSLDTTFKLGSGPNDWVLTLAVQPDGKILVGGLFWTINTVTRQRVARLNTDGSLDKTFALDGTNSWVNTLAVQQDGKILLGGYFTVVNKVERNRIARLNVDGSLDKTFDPGKGMDESVHKLVALPNGKVIVGGEFRVVNGVRRSGIAQLNADGSLDKTFDAGRGVDKKVKALAVQPNGKIIIGGEFTRFNGMAANHLARLNMDGSLDTTFGVGSGADNEIWTAVVQPDGKVVIGGMFGNINMVAQSHIARVQ